jgi:hypothetical protein
MRYLSVQEQKCVGLSNFDVRSLKLFVYIIGVDDCRYKHITKS